MNPEHAMNLPDDLKHSIVSEASRLHGWTVPERCVEMAELIFEVKPKIVVELGTFAGRSFISQAMALRHLNCGRIYGVDPHKTEAALEGENDANRAWWSTVNMHTIHQDMVGNIWRLGLDEWAIVIRAASQHCHEIFHGIQILIVDSNHSEVASCRDVTLWLPRVVSGGYIWFDDADWASTNKATAMLGEQCDLVKDAVHYRLYRKR